MKFFNRFNKFLSNYSQRQKMLKDPKMRKVSQDVKQSMDTGTRALQHACEICLFIAMIISLVILTGMAFSVNLVIGDALLFLASGLMYWRLCHIMANRINKKHRYNAKH